VYLPSNSISVYSTQLVMYRILDRRAFTLELLSAIYVLE
jgi:hypothetical protein